LLTAVLDSSALLALVQGEQGTDVVVDVIDGSVVSAASWSEFVQKALRHADDGPRRVREVRSLGPALESVTPEDGERAAEIGAEAAHLSLADRCCLGTAERLGLPAVTADRAWLDAPTSAEIRLIR
jgi:PIN domain nuclease of toxin-antitoxin system